MNDWVNSVDLLSYYYLYWIIHSAILVFIITSIELLLVFMLETRWWRRDLMADLLISVHAYQEIHHHSIYHLLNYLCHSFSLFIIDWSSIFWLDNISAMKRLDKATYITHLRFAKPDANQFIRLQTVYLSQISESQLQTSDGIINLTLPYQGPKL